MSRKIVGANKKKIAPRKAKAKRGRPFAGTERVSCRLPVGLLADIDEWRAKQQPKPSRPRAIRRFLEVALGVEYAAGTYRLASEE